MINNKEKIEDIKTTMMAKSTDLNVNDTNFILINNNYYCVEPRTPEIKLNDKEIAACTTYLDLEFQERAPILNSIARMLEMLDVDYLFFVLNSVLDRLDIHQLQKVHDDFKTAVQTMEDNLCSRKSNMTRDLYENCDN